MFPARGLRPIKSLVLLAAAAGMLATAACGGGSAGDAQNTSGATQHIAMAATNSVPGLPPFVAKEKGFFAEHGFDVELIPSLRGGAIMQALSSDSVQLVTQTTAAVALAAQKGEQLQMVSPNTKGIPYGIVVSDRNPEIPVAPPGPAGWQATIQSLKGKVIGAYGAGSTFDPVLKSMFVGAGLQGTDFTNRLITPGGPELTALMSGQVDAVLTDLANANAITAKGGFRTVLDLTRSGPPEVTGMAWSGLIARVPTLTQDPTFASRVQAVFSETRAFMQDPANAAELHRIAVEVAGIPADTPKLDESIATQASLLQSGFTQAEVQQTLDYLTTTGQLTPQPAVKPSDIVDAGALRT